MDGNKTIEVYDVAAYRFDAKDPKYDRDRTDATRFERLRKRYLEEGMRKTVEAVLLVHQHGHPHILLLQAVTSFFRLPGGRIKPGISEIDGLKQKLTTRLAPVGSTPDWEILDLLSVWWRPTYANHFFPYKPPHCTKPIECRKLFLVALPENFRFEIPSNWKFIAMPLVDLLHPSLRIGNVITSIPCSLSRFNILLSALPAPPESNSAATQIQTSEATDGSDTTTTEASPSVVPLTASQKIEEEDAKRQALLARNEITSGPAVDESLFGATEKIQQPTDTATGMDQDGPEDLNPAS